MGGPGTNGRAGVGCTERTGDAATGSDRGADADAAAAMAGGAAGFCGGATRDGTLVAAGFGVGFGSTWTAGIGASERNSSPSDSSSSDTNSPRTPSEAASTSSTASSTTCGSGGGATLGGFGADGLKSEKPLIVPALGWGGGATFTGGTGTVSASSAAGISS